MKRSTLCIIQSALCLLLSCSPALAQPGRRDRDEDARASPKVLAAFRTVVAKPSQSVVRIQCDGKDVALGTVVGADGLVLTKASQLVGAPVCKMRDGRDLEAKVVGVDEAHDLALLKVEAKGLAAVSWKPSKQAEPGDWVASAGPADGPPGIGVVSVAARSVSPRSYPRVINVNGGFLGVTGEPEDSGDGVRVSRVEKDSAADKAEIQVDDLITAINGKRVRDLESLQEALGQFRPRDTVTVRIVREGEEKDLKVTLGRRPAGASRADFQNSMGSELSAKRTGFPNILQHDSVIRPVDCGGPLVDLDGKAVGINIARAGRTESYAIPSDTVLALLTDLKSGKLAPKAAEEKDGAAEAAVRRAEAQLAAAEKKRETAKAALKQAEEALELFGKDDADAADLHRRAVTAAKKADDEVAAARAALEKARGSK